MYHKEWETKAALGRNGKTRQLCYTRKRKRLAISNAQYCTWITQSYANTSIQQITHSYAMKRNPYSLLIPISRVSTRNKRLSEYNEEQENALRSSAHNDYHFNPYWTHGTTSLRKSRFNRLSSDSQHRESLLPNPMMMGSKSSKCKCVGSLKSTPK